MATLSKSSKKKRKFTALKEKTDVDVLDNQTEHVVDCVEDIFCNIESINTAEIIDSSVSSDDVPIDGELDNESVEDNMSINDESSRRKINFLSLINVFDQLKKELEEINVNKVMLNKKKRLQSSNELCREVCNNVLRNKDEFDVDCKEIFECQSTSNPWFRTKY